MGTVFEQIKRNRHCYLWIAPFFILFIGLYAFPLLYGFYISFTKYGGMSAPEFIGLKNYVNAFKDQKFYNSLANTFILWALIVPARTFLSLLFACLLNSRKLLGRRVYSGIVLLPYITASAVAAIVFRILFTTEGGMINVLLGNLFNIQPLGWLDTTELSKVSVAIMNLWRMTGYFALVLLAGMQKIPVSVDEAALIDGVGPVRKFIHITIPLMIPELFFVAMISTIWIFQNVSDVMMLTKGGPINSSTTLVYYIYQNAYEFSDKMGYASALSNLLFLILIIFSIFLVKNYYGKAEG